MKRAKSLIVVDDAAIRTGHYAAAGKLLGKIERLESAIMSFHASDQKLYCEWLELTFRRERAEEEEKVASFKNLARFHNSIVAMAQMLDISMPEAFRMITMEEDVYQRGDPETRARIDETRRERERFLQTEMEREFHEQDADDEEFPFDHDDEAENDCGSESVFSPEDRAEISRIQAMTDKKLHRELRDSEQGLKTLLKALRFVGFSGNPRLFLRIWDLAPHDLRKEAQAVCRANGISLKSEVESMREWVALDDQFGRGAHESDTDGEFEDEAASGNDSYIGLGGQRGQGRRTPAQLELIKMTYRKLARRLHPDAQINASVKDQAWRSKLWLRVQESYRAGHLAALEKLHRLVLLRDRELNSLTLDEILQSRDWLDEDLRALEREAKLLRRSPAWKFSKRKNFEPLLRSVRRDFKERVAHVDQEIEELRSYHALLKRLSSEPPRRRRPTRRRKPGKRPRRRTRSSSDEQMSML